MGLFSKKCEFCDGKIEKGKEVNADVKVPEFVGLRARPFCSCECAEEYSLKVTGTKRTKFCPSCPV